MDEICNMFKYRFNCVSTLWAVLSILLDTQDDKCEYVKCLQEGYNIQYEGKSG